MAVFRVEKTKDFTVMSNHHLRNVSDGELRETQTANYFSNIYPIDCAVLSVNA